MHPVRVEAAEKLELLREGPMISSLPRIVVVLWLLIHAVAVAQQPRYGKLRSKAASSKRLVLNDENHQPYDFPAPGAVVSVPWEDTGLQWSN